ncbi:MAG TPA: sigma-70 family RNA polymerase sigma factor, partial [Polyangiaceae bacterium]|nr:sigma-70 family RNA polymerase sigma factor [Polyangiaceae bacterium]
MSRRGERPVYDDATLIQRLLDNDDDAWRAFHDRYSHQLLGVISRVTRRFPQLTGTDHLEEIYASLCLRLLNDDKRRLKSFDPERGTPLGSWLCALARNSAHDFLRHHRRQPWLCRLGEEITDVEMPSDVPDAFSVCSSREQARALTQLVDSLSARDREFLGAYLQGFEPEQIAAQLGISVSTVYSKKHK